MPSTENSTDEAAIWALIQAQFDSIEWAPGRDSDWLTFHCGFVLGAQLWPAKRPQAKPRKERRPDAA